MSGFISNKSTKLNFNLLASQAHICQELEIREIMIVQVKT